MSISSSLPLSRVHQPESKEGFSPVPMRQPAPPQRLGSLSVNERSYSRAESVWRWKDDLMNASQPRHSSTSMPLGGESIGWSPLPYYSSGVVSCGFGTMVPPPSAAAVVSSPTFPTDPTTTTDFNQEEEGEMDAMAKMMHQQREINDPNNTTMDMDRPPRRRSVRFALDAASATEGANYTWATTDGSGSLPPSYREDRPEPLTPSARGFDAPLHHSSSGIHSGMQDPAMIPASGSSVSANDFGGHQSDTVPRKNGGDDDYYRGSVAGRRTRSASAQRLAQRRRESQLHQSFYEDSFVEDYVLSAKAELEAEEKARREAEQAKRAEEDAAIQAALQKARETLMVAATRSLSPVPPTDATSATMALAGRPSRPPGAAPSGAAGSSKDDVSLLRSLEEDPDPAVQAALRELDRIAQQRRQRYGDGPQREQPPAEERKSGGNDGEVGAQKQQQEGGGGGSNPNSLRSSRQSKSRVEQLVDALLAKRGLCSGSLGSTSTAAGAPGGRPPSVVVIRWPSSDRNEALLGTESVEYLYDDDHEENSNSHHHAPPPPPLNDQEDELGGPHHERAPRPRNTSPPLKKKGRGRKPTARAEHKNDDAGKDRDESNHNNNSSGSTNYPHPTRAGRVPVGGGGGAHTAARGRSHSLALWGEAPAEGSSSLSTSDALGLHTHSRSSVSQSNPHASLLVRAQRQRAGAGGAGASATRNRDISAVPILDDDDDDEAANVQLIKMVTGKDRSGKGQASSSARLTTSLHHRGGGAAPPSSSSPPVDVIMQALQEEEEQDRPTLLRRRRRPTQTGTSTTTTTTTLTAAATLLNGSTGTKERGSDSSWSSVAQGGAKRHRKRGRPSRWEKEPKDNETAYSDDDDDNEDEDDDDGDRRPRPRPRLRHDHPSTSNAMVGEGEDELLNGTLDLHPDSTRRAARRTTASAATALALSRRRHPGALSSSSSFGFQAAPIVSSSSSALIAPAAFAPPSRQMANDHTEEDEEEDEEKYHQGGDRMDNGGGDGDEDEDEDEAMADFYEEDEVEYSPPHRHHQRNDAPSSSSSSRRGRRSAPNSTKRTTTNNRRERFADGRVREMGRWSSLQSPPPPPAPQRARTARSLSTSRGVLGDPMAVFLDEAFPSPSKFDALAQQAGGLLSHRRGGGSGSAGRRRGGGRPWSDAPNLSLPITIEKEPNCLIMMPNPVGFTPFSALLIPPEYHDDVLHGGAELIEKEMCTPSALALRAGAAGSRESADPGGNHNNNAAAAHLSPPNALSYHLHILDAEERHELLRMHQQQGLEQSPPVVSASSASPAGGASSSSSSSPPTAAAALLPPAAAAAVCQVHERYLQRLAWARAFLQRDRCFSRWLTCPEDPMLWPSAVSENWLEVTEAIRVLREVEGTGEAAEEAGQGRGGSRGLDTETMVLAEALTTTRAGASPSASAGASAAERQKTAKLPADRRYLLALQEAWKILHAEATRPGVYPVVPVSVAGTLTPYHGRRSSLEDETTSPSSSSFASSSLSAAASLAPLNGDLSAGGAAVYTRGKASALRANCHSDQTALDRPHRLHGGGGDPLQAVREKEGGGGGAGIYLLQMPHHPRLFSPMEILELPLTSKAMLQLVHHFYEQNSIGTDMKMITMHRKDQKSPAAAGVRGLWLALVGLHRSRFVQSSSAGLKHNNNNNNNENSGTHGNSSNGSTLMIVRSSSARRPSSTQQHPLSAVAATSSSDTSSLLPLMGSAQDFLQSGWCGWSTQFSHSAAASATSRGGERSSGSAEHSGRGRTHGGGASGVHKSFMGGGSLLTATEWATRQYLQQQQQQAAALLGLDSRTTGSAYLLLEDRNGADGEDDDGEPEAFLAERVRAAHQSAGAAAAAAGSSSMIRRHMDKGMDNSNNNNNNNNNNSVPHCIRLQSGVYATVLHLLHAVCLFITEIEEYEEDGAANRAAVSDSRPSSLSSSTSQPDAPLTPRALLPSHDDVFTAYKRSPADWVLLDRVVAPPGSEMRSSLEQQLHMSLSQAWRRGLLRVFTRRRCSWDRSSSSSSRGSRVQEQSSRVAAPDPATAPPSLEDVWTATRQSFWSPFIVAHHQAQEEGSQTPVSPRPAPTTTTTTTTTSTVTTDQWVESYCAVPPQWLSLPPSSTIALSVPTTTVAVLPAAVSSSSSSSTTSASKEAPRTTTLKLFVHAVRIRTRYNPFLLFHGDRVEHGWKGRMSVLRALKRRREELPEAYAEQQLMASLRRRARGETPASAVHHNNNNNNRAAGNTNSNSTNPALSSPPPPCSLVGTELREAVRSTLMKVLAAEPLSKADLLQHTQMRKYAASPFFEPVVQALLKEGRSSQTIQYKGRKYELCE